MRGVDLKSFLAQEVLGHAERHGDVELSDEVIWQGQGICGDESGARSSAGENPPSDCQSFVGIVQERGLCPVFGEKERIRSDAGAYLDGGETVEAEELSQEVITNPFPENRFARLL